MEENQPQQNETVDFYVKLFFMNFQGELKDQLCNMIYACKSFCECFDDTEEDVFALESLYGNPIAFILTDYKTHFSDKRRNRISIKKTVAELEFIYFRDTKRNSSLRKEYHIDDNKPRRTKYLTLADVIALRGFIKMAVSNIFTRVSMEHGVKLDPLNLPTIINQTVQQVGVEDFEN